MSPTNSKRPSVLILYTGGTIGMVQRPGTGALTPVKFEQILEEVPELKKFNLNIDTTVLNPVIDSSNMNPSVWGKIARIIHKKYRNYDGFVILHGTDTMAFTASALSYIFDNLDKPVILTGSQLPIGTLRTDGKENLITAVEIAASKRNGKAMVPEVCIYFDFKLYRGNRTVKRDAELFSAFHSVNYPELAVAGVDINYRKEFIHYPENKGILKVNTSFNDNIVILKMFPGISKSVVTSVFNIPGLKGVVLETFGSGNVPTDRWLVSCVKRAVKNGVIVLNITQCEGGKVSMGQYDTSMDLLNAGVISGNDMTTEAATTKLMFLLGQGLSLADVKMYLKKSLRGEISE